MIGLVNVALLFQRKYFASALPYDCRVGVTCHQGETSAM